MNKTQAIYDMRKKAGILLFIALTLNTAMYTNNDNSQICNF